MSDLFDPSLPSPDTNYVALRDNERFSQLRAICEDMWRSFAQYSDPEFPRQFATHLHPRFWELYLGHQLLNLGFKLVPKASSFGPDFHVLLGDRSVWIEAAAPDEGQGDDAVPALEEHSKFDPIPEDKIILRFTNAVYKKKQKFEEYVRNGTVRPEDALVIALNGRSISMLIFDGPLPLVIKSVYPIGGYKVTIDVKTRQVVQEGYETRFQIVKHSGAAVGTKAFMDDDFAPISGLLYSHAALWDMPAGSPHEFLYIHNSTARNPLEVGWLGVGRDCDRTGDQLLLTASA